MRRLALVVAAIFGFSWWLVPLVMHEQKASVVLEVAVLLAWLFVAIVSFQYSRALKQYSFAELIANARTQPFFLQEGILRTVVALLFFGSPIISAVLLIQYVELSKGWDGLLITAVILSLGALCYFVGRRIEKAFAHSVLRKFIEDVNAASRHEDVFKRYTSYVPSWKRIENINAYEVHFRPAEFVRTVGFEAYVLQLVYDSVSRRWGLKQPWQEL